MTGTCAPSALALCEAFGNILHPLEPRLAVPPLPIPDLEVVAHPDHDDLLVQHGVLHQRRRQHHPPLAVELGLLGAAEEETLELASLAGERIEPAELQVGEALPALRVPDEQALVPALGDDHAAGETRPEAGRKRDAVLG